MKYVLIDQIKNGDCFIKEFDTLEKALKGSQEEFDRLTQKDKNKRSEFYLIKSFNSDENAIDHLDGYIIEEWIYTECL